MTVYNAITNYRLVGALKIKPLDCELNFSVKLFNFLH